MKGGNMQILKRLPLGRTEVFFLSVACISLMRTHLPAAAALVINPQHALLTNSLSVAFHTPQLRTDTKLQTKLYNNADDFASFSDDNEGDDGQQLAREFYEELGNRQHKISEMKIKENDETYTVRGDGGQSQNKEDGSKNKIRTVTIRADTSPASRKVFTNQQAPASSQDSPLFSLFSFLSPPQPRPATSAGLFSGSGTTVYSSGRSIRAEIEILETTMKNNDSKNKQGGWDGIYVSNPEQLEEVLRIVAMTLILASATYIAIEASGGLHVTSFDQAADHVMSLMTDATKDGMSSIMISAGNGDVFMGEEAAWLMRESSDLAASVVGAVRSVEELVLS